MGRYPYASVFGESDRVVRSSVLILFSESFAVMIGERSRNNHLEEQREARMKDPLNNNKRQAPGRGRHLLAVDDNV